MIWICIRWPHCDNCIYLCLTYIVGRSIIIREQRDGPKLKFKCKSRYGRFAFLLCDIWAYAGCAPQSYSIYFYFILNNTLSRILCDSCFVKTERKQKIAYSRNDHRKFLKSLIRNMLLYMPCNIFAYIVYNKSIYQSKTYSKFILITWKTNIKTKLKN
jgi:hypothetical protein